MTDFAFTKDSGVISRSFTSSNGAPTIAGLLLKQNRTGCFAKRWFVLHTHCLSYYRVEPAYWQAQQLPCGMLDLHHVVATFVNECTITLQLTEQATQARSLTKDQFFLPHLRKPSPTAATTNTYVLRTKSQRQAKLWFDAICNVVNTSSTIDGGSSCETNSTTLSTPPWSSSSSSLRRLVPRLETLQVGGVLFGEEDCLHLRDERKVLLVPHAFKLGESGSNNMTVTLTNGASETRDFAPLKNETHGIVRLLGVNQARVSVYWKRRRLQQQAKATTVKGVFSTMLMLAAIWNLSIAFVMILMLVEVVSSNTRKCNDDELVITNVSVKRNSTLSSSSTSLRDISPS